MKIAVAGTGYVGLVAGVCFAEKGYDVTCVDVDEKKIEMMRQGISPIYEDGLEELMQKNNARGTLHFTTDHVAAYKDADVIFIGVGTPEMPDGSANLSYIATVSRQIAESVEKDCLVVVKSTVPVGTNDKVEQFIKDFLVHDVEVEVASNPEFLAQGTAVHDTLHAARIIIGTESKKAEELLKKIYEPFGLPIVSVKRRSAEMIKYACNDFLALKISYMNDIANLCELIGADVNMVRKGIGSDSRIGNKFLYPGCGYGGSCFPKDVKALIKTAKQHGYDMKVLNAVESVNDIQKEILYKKLKQHFDGNLNDRTIAIWGLSFKPETDDMREAPALVLINALLKENCKIKVYDPIAMNECRRKLGSVVEYCENKYQATIEADALVLVTEWKEFRIPDWNLVKQNMKGVFIVDGRNLYNKTELERNSFIYTAIGC